LLNLSNIREYLNYDPATGIFTWIKRPSAWSARKPGDVAGIYSPARRYRQIKFGGKLYGAHRLAWWWVNGEWPLHDLDHENRNKDDNRIANLRPATGTQNQGNCGLQTRNTSGYRGVSFVKRSGVWAVGIHKRYIGQFATAEQAARAYDRAAREYFGEFAYQNFPEVVA
jgi:hypothetical protein